MDPFMNTRKPGLLARRQFLAATGGTALASALLPAQAAFTITPRRRTAALRTITYNILACRGFKLTDENRAILSKARKQIPVKVGHIVLSAAGYRWNRHR